MRTKNKDKVLWIQYNNKVGYTSFFCHMRFQNSIISDFAFSLKLLSLFQAMPVNNVLKMSGDRGILYFRETSKLYSTEMNNKSVQKKN